MAETPQQDTPSLVEGEEEVQYVFVSLPNDVDPVAFGPGSVVTVEGLSTEQPTVRAGPSNQQGNAAGRNGSGSRVLQGRYVDTLGSVLLMKEYTAAHNSTPVFTYMGHTDKALHFNSAG